MLQLSGFYIEMIGIKTGIVLQNCVYIHLDNVMLPYIWVYNLCLVVAVDQVVDCYFSWEHSLPADDRGRYKIICVFAYTTM